MKYVLKHIFKLRFIYVKKFASYPAPVGAVWLVKDKENAKTFNSKEEAEEFKQKIINSNDYDIEEA